MSLIFLDGCEHWDSTSALSKWTSHGGPGMTPNVLWGRSGGKGIFLGFGGGGRASPVRKQLLPADEHATLIVGCAFAANSPLPSTTTALISLCSDALVTRHVSLCVSASGQLSVRRGTSSGTVLGTESGATFATVSTFHYVELKAVLSDTVGTVEVRVDGAATAVISLTSQDTKNAGTKTVF